MKKIMILAAAAALALVACAKVETIQNTNEENAIVFGAYSGKVVETKTSAITTSTLTSFGVYAYYTDGANWSASATPNFMFNQSVSGSHAGGFTYSPLKYWPNETSDKLSFFAYAPYMTMSNGIEEESENTDTGAPTIKYTMPALEANQVDLLWATPLKNQQRDTYGNNGKVAFVFNHALAKIEVKVRYLLESINEGNTIGSDLAGETTVTLNEVHITGPFGAAEGILNLENGSWSDIDLSDGSDVTYSTTGLTQTVTKSNAAVTGINPAIILPNSTADPAAGYDVEVTVKYTVETADTNLNGNKSTVVNTITNTINNMTFVGGYAYNIVLVLGLESVKVDATVSDSWAAGADSEVDLPINTAI